MQKLVRRAGARRAATAGLIICSQAGCSAPQPATAPETKGQPLPPLPPELAGLTALESGAGVIFGDPVYLGEKGTGAALPDAAAFGAGCTRWLQLELSDHLELGKMPGWPEFSALGGKAVWKDGGLPPGEAASLAHASGVTHVVVSSIAGDARDATLTLQLLALPAGTPVGQPVVVRGSYAEINTALPGTAGTFLTALGAAADALPRDTGATEQVLMDCGRAPLDSARPLPPDLKFSLALAARTTPVAGLLGWRAADGHFNDRQTYFADHNQNLAVKAFIARDRPDRLGTLPPRLEEAIGKATPNYLLCTLQGFREKETKTGDGGVAAFQRATRCAPRNPQAWRTLAEACDDSSDAIRYGRTAGQMSRAEWQSLATLYSRWVSAATRVTTLDPQSGEAWLELAHAATFNGDRAAATRAIWRAQSLAPENPKVYSWALQMFQPKWGGNPADLRRAIALASGKPARLAASAADIMEAMPFVLPADASHWGTIDKIFREVVLNPKGWLGGRPRAQAALKTAWQAARSNPKNARAWQKCAEEAADAAGYIRMARSRTVLGPAESDAIDMLYAYWRIAAERWTNLEPKNADAWLQLSRVGAFRGDGAAELRKALALAPHNKAVNRWDLTMRRPQWFPDRRTLWAAVRRVDSDPQLNVDLSPNLAVLFPDYDNLGAADKKAVDKIWGRLGLAMERPDAEVQKQVAFFFEEWERKPEAKTAFANWARLDAKNPEPEYRFGAFLHNQQLYPEAVTHYRRALAVDPDYGPALYWLASILPSDPKSASEAERLYRRATVVLPLWPKAWSGLGEFYYRNKRYPESLAAFRQVRTLVTDEEKAGKAADEKIASLEALMHGGGPVPMTGSPGGAPPYATAGKP